MSDGPDIVIIGSGIGGSTAAAALAPSGRRILILERGERLPDTAEARDEAAIFGRGHFRPDEEWETPGEEAFNPGNYYCVGGNSKLYGAVLIRYRAEDFRPIRHLGGTTPGWPITYDDLEPWYQRAEELFRVRGDAGEDPTEPAHSGAYPFPPVPDEPSIADFRARMKRAGLTPSSQPLGVDIDAWLKRAATPWDAFPDTTGAKCDGESVGIAEALRHPNVTLETGARVTRLEAGAGGRIVAVEYRKGAGTVRLVPRLVILSAGAVNSAVLLLRSGLANRSDQVGRNFMNHNCSAVLAVSPFRRNTSVYQKTVLLNDFYLTGGKDGTPLGNVQTLGKISGGILAAAGGLPRVAAGWLAAHSVDLYAMSEDLPNPESRVTLRGERIVLDWRRSNWETHEALVAKLKSVLKRAGYPIVLSRPFDRRTPSHQCGTARMGTDPATSVVDVFCRTHDHGNLFVVDASFLPTSAAVNPALTIAAQALRTADHITRRDFAA
ncbi:choline dehydrogenase-like flavoprotein [Amaricoccus macauensis]|uniref:Choline dehydrogenase-like flavoprotein n=1 Tax=Amaricoccus macauensis TaxID=57001 RepID=A0A840SII7_9RHOB|nr:GMC family oxidoreductase [Amaricoccus macauensis]MBB5221687.1 choline dehydrogenase-like flavoprotein [Amaricoccus macauensis]